MPWVRILRLERTITEENVRQKGISRWLDSCWDIDWRYGSLADGRGGCGNGAEQCNTRNNERSQKHLKEVGPAIEEECRDENVLNVEGVNEETETEVRPIYIRDIHSSD